MVAAIQESVGEGCPEQVWQAAITAFPVQKAFCCSQCGRGWKFPPTEGKHSLNGEGAVKPECGTGIHSVCLGQR